MNQYVFQDRTLVTKWAMTVADEQILITETSDDAQSEPIVEDFQNAGTYYKLFVDDGMMGWETDVTVQNDTFVFVDTVTGLNYRYAIIDDQAALIAQVTAAIVRLTKFIIVRYDEVRKIVRYNETKRNVRFDNIPKIAI